MELTVPKYLTKVIGERVQELLIVKYPTYLGIQSSYSPFTSINQAPLDFISSKLVLDLRESSQSRTRYCSLPYI